MNEPAPLKVQQVREDRAPRRRHKARIESRISRTDDLADGARSLRHDSADLPLALQPVADEVPHILLGVGDRGTMGGIIDSVVALPQLVSETPDPSPDAALFAQLMERLPASTLMPAGGGAALPGWRLTRSRHRL